MQTSGSAIDATETISTNTFRSNQIREGQLTREKALEMVQDENRPRYQNLRWYLDTLGMDFKEVIPVINSMPKLYREA